METSLVSRTPPMAVASRIGVVAHAGKSLGGGLGELRDALATCGIEQSDWRVVEKSKKAPKQVRHLLEAGVERLIVWGGDGTVRRCIHTIIEEGADIEVAIIPAGTANLLARALSIPVDLQAAADVALGSVTRRIDVGRINDESFAVMAGVGLDSLMIRDADEAKDRLGRLAYLWAGARHLGADGFEATIDVDGSEWFRGHAACVLIGNTGSLLGGVSVLPAARMDDGVIDVGVVTARRRRDWLGVGLRAVVGRVDASPLVHVAQGSEVSVRLDRKHVWELDGGDRPKAKALDVSILPARISVCVGLP